MTHRRKHILQPLFLVAAFFIAQFTFAAQAMAVYNDTSVAINAYFGCGWFCQNKWEPINPGDSRSRPGEAGSLLAWKGYDVIGRDPVRHGCDVDVDEHGWVVFTPGGGTVVNVNSYHQDGSSDDSCTFDPSDADMS